MRLISLTLKGFKGFRAGIGLEEVRIDFSKLPGGLIAIVGSNGMGKTTLLDNMHPYRIMPYKLRENKEWSANSFNYYDQCYGEACKELIFEIGGIIYKALILINADKRKQEAYLYREVEGLGTWTPLNDGKTGTYDAAIEKVAGSPSLFFSSVFRAQDARKLSSYPRSEILTIISELLNIDHIKAQGDKAREVANILLGDVQKKRTQIETMMPTIDRKEETVVDYDAKSLDLAAAENRVTALKKELSDLEASYHTTELANAAQAEAKKRLDGLLDQRRELEAEILRLGKQAIDANDEFNVETTRYQAELTKLKTAVDNEISLIGAEVASIESALAQADTFRQLAAGKETAENALTSAKDECEKLRGDYQEAQARLLKAQKLDGEITSSVQQQTSLKQARERDKQRIAADLDRCRKQSANLNVLDCRADSTSWVNEACPLLVDAVAAKGKIAGLESELADCDLSTLDEDMLATKIEDLQLERKEIGDPKTDQENLAKSGKDKAQEVSELEAKVKVINDNAAKVAELTHAETRLKELTERKVSRLHDVVLKETEVEGLVKSCGERRQIKEKEITTSQGAARAKLEILSTEITTLQETLSSDVAEKLAQIKGGIDSAKASLGQEERRVPEIHAEIGRIKGQLTAIAEKEGEVRFLEGDIAVLNADISDWQLLAKACSNDGIIALELDDAGPSIAGLANDLLLACYGPRFTVRLETQATKNDGSTKEVFDITIFDAERDEEKSIRDCSGGEITWVEDAITRAICLYNLNRSDIRYETLYSDEKDGALDSDRKGEFLAIKRRALEIGTHEREFFISQTLELQEGSDAKIILAPGGVTVG